MKKVLSMSLTGLMATLVFTISAVSAAQLDVTVDKKNISPGDSITISGTITEDVGSFDEFTYRAAAIVPGSRDGGKRIIICDSGRQITKNESVSFKCEVPSLEDLEKLGVNNVAKRAFIPLKGGIAVKDPETNRTIKRHGNVMIVNSVVMEEKLKKTLERIGKFIERVEGKITECNKMIERAEEAGAENVVDRCANFQARTQDQINRSLNAQERINDLLGNSTNLDSLNFGKLRSSFSSFDKGSRDFRSDVRDIKDLFVRSRETLEKRASKEIVDRTKQRVSDLREDISRKTVSIKDRKDFIKDRLNDIEGKILERRPPVAVRANDAKRPDSRRGEKV